MKCQRRCLTILNAICHLLKSNLLPMFRALDFLATLQMFSDPAVPKNDDDDIRIQEYKNTKL